MSQQPAMQPDPSPTSRKSVTRSRVILGLVAAGVVLGAALLVSLGFLAVRTLLPSEEPSSIPLEITRVVSSPLSPTPFSPPIVEVGESRMPLAVPVLLEAGGRSIQVQPSNPQGQDPWTAPAGQPGAATWIYGTVVNYVLGLEPTADNREMMDGLRKGDPILLRLSSGTRLTFRVQERQTVTAGTEALFAQTRPGLTLVLRDPDTWSVVTADFEAATEPTPAAGEALAGTEQAVQVGDTRVTVIEGHAERGGAGLPSGTMIYFVEFSVRNTGTAPLNPAVFLMVLEDGLGNRYTPSTSASEAGRYGSLPDTIGPGQEVNGSAAYVVPDTLPGPNLIWIFSPSPTLELRARFSIPYSPPTPPATLPEVRVLEAFLGEGGAILHIVMEIHNPGNAPLTVGDQDISLSSSAGPGELRAAAPPFPWTIAAGDTRQVELQFARPGASTAVVTVLGYTFEISGMP